MKRFAILCCCLYVLNSHATTRRVGFTATNPVSGVDYTTLQAAHDASTTGDTIQVYPTSPSSTTWSCTMTKALVLIGTGYFTDGGFNANTNLQNIGGLCNVDITLGTGSSGSTFLGLGTSKVLNNTYPPSAGGVLVIWVNGSAVVNNITVKNCNVGAAQLTNGVINDSWTFAQCLFPLTAGYYSPSSSSLYVTGSAITNLEVENCIFIYGFNLSNNNNPVTGITGQLVNCSFSDHTANTFDFGNGSLLVQNCIWYGGNTWFKKYSSCIFKNNITPSGSSGNPMNTAGSSGNQYGISFTAGPGDGPGGASIISNNRIFVGYPYNTDASGNTVYSPDGMFQIKPSSFAAGAGVGGVDCGAFGGTNPYKIAGIPPTPAFYKLTASSSTTSTSPYAITYSVRSNATANIVKAEYFLDYKDPGTGLGTDMSISTGTDLSNQVLNANVYGLAAGNHTLHVRALDANGSWSHVNTFSFTMGADLPVTWTGGTSTNWAAASNWNSGSVPSTTHLVSIPSGTTFSPSFFSAPATIASLTVANGATITNSSILNISNALNNGGTISGGTLNVGGTVTNNGSIINNVSLNLNGSTAQTIAGTGTVGNLTLNNSNGATITSGVFNMLTITGTYTPTTGTLTTNGNLTLASSASGTARIAAGTGTYISGTVTQQRYIPAKSSRTWSFVASPFTQTINSSWQQQVHITGLGTGGTVCPSLTSNSNGFDATVTNSPSMYVYDGTKAVGSRWTSIASTTGVSLTAGTGYRVNIRGPRSTGCSLLDGSVSTTSAVTLSSTGTLSNGSKNMGSFSTTTSNNGNTTVSNDNYLLVGNPYPSQISFDALRTANSSVISNSYAIYAPGNTVGNYAFWNGTTWSGGNTGLSDATGDIIANGQAFFVKGTVAGASITLNWTESMKSASTQNGYFRNSTINPNKVRIGYFLGNGNKADEIMIEFMDKASNSSLNDGDVLSINTGSQNLKSIKGGQELVFNTRNVDFVSDTVQLNVASSNNGQFKLSFYDFEEFVQASHVKVHLLDNHTGISQLMNDQKEYIFNVDTNMPSTFGTGRFAVVFSKAAPINLTVVEGVKAYPNPVSSQLNIELPAMTEGQYSIRLLDAAGNTILQQQGKKGNNFINTSKLPVGNYMLEVNGPKSYKQSKKIVKL